MKVTFKFAKRCMENRVGNGEIVDFLRQVQFDDCPEAVAPTFAEWYEAISIRREMLFETYMNSNIDYEEREAARRLVDKLDLLRNELRSCEVPYSK